jgi:predicted Zn-dependent protease
VRTDVDYHFEIVDMPEPNAFALPGGFVYVSRGLLALLNSEDELASVIGHEIGHVAAHHHCARR